MENITKILIRAKQLLIDYGWTQKRFARDKFGNVTRPRLKNAVCFCIGGAIMRASGPNTNKNCHLANKALGLLVNVVKENIYIWNDNPKRNKDQVLKAFDKAIKKSQL